MNEKNKRYLSVSLLSILLILIDQISKYIIRHSGGFYICNKGVAFGISGIFSWLILAGVIISVFLERKRIRLLITDYYLLVAIVFSGGISNLLDRLFLGCVIDFVDFGFWPVFNLADVFIFIGGITIIAKILNSKR